MAHYFDRSPLELWYGAWNLDQGQCPICYTHIEKGRAGQLRPLLSAAIILDPAIEATHAQNAARGAAGFFYRLMIEEMIANEDWRKSLFLHSAK